MSPAIFASTILLLLRTKWFLVTWEEALQLLKVVKFYGLLVTAQFSVLMEAMHPKAMIKHMARSFFH